MFPALSAELKFPNRSQILKKEKIRIHNLAISIQYFKSKDNWNTLQNSPNSWDIRNIICEAIDILDRQFRVKGKCADELYLLTRVQLIASISRFNIYWWLCKHELLLIKSIFFSITCHLTVSSSTSRRRPTLQKRGKKTTQTSTSTTMMKSLFRRESQKAGDRIPKFLIVSSVKWTTFLLQLRQQQQQQRRQLQQTSRQRQYEPRQHQRPHKRQMKTKHLKVWRLKHRPKRYVNVYQASS